MLSTSSGVCCVCLAAVLLALGGPALTIAQQTASQPPAAVSEQRVAELIEQMGAADFASREKAQAELERLGLVAFDSLHAAQSHDDIEIAMRARYLVRSMQVNWVLETDPPDVKRILRDYGERNDLERRARMDQLAALPSGEGTEALARLARFEPHNLLSKLAALLVMKGYESLDQPDRAGLAEKLEAIAGHSQRPSALWLRAYAQTLRDPQSSLARWDELSRAEELAFAQFTDQSSRALARDLLRWQADLLRGLERSEEALAVMQRSIGLVEGSREELLDTIGWLMEREAWSLVDQVAQRHPGPFADDALLLYRLAESQWRRGDQPLASQTAAQARQLVPHDHDLHVESATWLYERGLVEWAMAELQYVIAQGAPGDPSQLRARFLLAEMLHDAGQELAAADTLQVIVQTLDEDPKALELVQRMRDPGSIRSRMHYFYSQHFADQADRAQQQQHLEQATEADPTDADALIGMYRLPDATPQWKEQTKTLIEQAADHYRGQIDQWQQQYDSAQHDQQRALYAYPLATAYNQFAWLISNTEGDYNEALRASHRSLELRPQSAGFLDTLGRCYYAKGDLESAIKYQSEAVELEPHSGQIRRQLEFFQDELAAAQKSGERTHAAAPSPQSSSR